MARPLRIEFAGALYYLTSRGDRREAIYEDDAGRLRFLDVLAEVADRPGWSAVDALLGQFASAREDARRRYRAFVSEGVGEGIWQGLRQQIYLGDEAFLTRMPAIVAAYATGAYTHREIADYFGVHLATVGRIVRGGMQPCEN